MAGRPIGSRGAPKHSLHHRGEAGPDANDKTVFRADLLARSDQPDRRPAKNGPAPVIMSQERGSAAPVAAFAKNAGGRIPAFLANAATAADQLETTLCREPCRAGKHCCLGRSSCLGAPLPSGACWPSAAAA